MKGFKAFDENLRCKGFQYEIGQTYEMDGEIECCERGFHFCKDLTDCYRHYPMIEDTRICEVEALGEIKTEDNIKYCTNKIKILSEVVNPRIKSNTYTSSIANHLQTMDICNVEKVNGVIVQSELTNRKVVLYDTVLHIIDEYKAEGNREIDI